MFHRVHLGLLFILLCQGCASNTPQPGSAGPDHAQLASGPATSAEPAPAPRRGASSAHGMKAYKDPVTGKFTTPPPGAVEHTDIPEQRGLFDAQEPLKAKPSPVPGGGIEIDLQGRFQSYTKATKGADGKISIECNVGKPGS